MFGFGVQRIYPKIIRPKYLFKAENVKQFPAKECKKNIIDLYDLTSTDQILCTFDMKAASSGDSGGSVVIKV